MALLGAPGRATAELIALCREGWEIELAFDEIKNHLDGRQLQLRLPLVEHPVRLRFLKIWARPAVNTMIKGGSSSVAKAAGIAR